MPRASERSGRGAVAVGTALGAFGALLGGLAACTGAPTPAPAAAPWRGDAWPAADALFHRDPRWRGADAAYSVDLGGDRTLWLFGDSYVARAGAGPGRASCALVRNSAAVQTGRDPTTAAIEFAWQGGDAPTSWLPEDGAAWFWPLGGLRIDDTVTLLCTRVVASGEPGVFGFRADGAAVFRCRGLDGPLASWRCERVPFPASPWPFAVVLATPLADGEHVYAYALREPGDHGLYALRWTRTAFARGDLAAPAWWSGRDWRPASALPDGPAVVVRDAAPEFSVSPLPGGGFAMVQSVGFGATTLGVRTSPRPEGPWSAPAIAWRPPESDLPGVLVYAGKAHPELDPDGLLCTYASNAFDFARAVADQSLYYPRFVRLHR